MEVGADEIASCVLCGSKSVCKCERCGDFYCSPQCQRKDWPNHRYICFPMPHLVKAAYWSPLKENGVAEGKIPFLQSNMPNKNDHKEEEQITSKGVEGPKMPTNESCVILTGFKTSNRCYIRSTNPSDEVNYKNILKEIDDFGKTAAGLTGKAKTQSYALALREGKWSRVQIFGNAMDKRLRIQFVDYGDFCKRHQKELRQINHHLISLPCYVHMVQLKDVKMISTASQLLESLSKYTNQEYKVVFEKGDNMGGNAKLFNWRNKTLLNTDIVKLCTNFRSNEKSMEADLVSNVSSSISNEAVNRRDLENPTSSKNSNQHNGQVKEANSPKNPKAENKNKKENSPKSSTVSNRKTITKPHQIQTLKPCLEPPFNISPLNENDRDCNVIITDDSFVEAGYIGCLMQKYRANLKEVAAFLKQYKVNDQPYRPKLHEYCLAKFENEWYRAKVIETISDDKYRVTYIDFTNEMELTSNSIRRYPMTLTVACHTTFCAIDGLPEDLSDGLIDFLKSECTAFTELHIDNVRVVENVCNVESKALLKKLHDNKLI